MSLRPWFAFFQIAPSLIVAAACSAGPFDEGGDQPPPPGPTDSSSDTQTALTCSAQLLVLGQATEAPEPTVLWTGDAFVVAWMGPNGYELRRIEGGQTAASATLEGKLSDDLFARPPQLLWNASRLELFYWHEEAMWLDVLNQDLGVVETKVLGADPLRVAALDDERIALRGFNTLIVGGTTFETSYLYAAALAFNGENFLASTALGHGVWHFVSTGPEGEYMPPVFDFTWTGVLGTGSAGGSALASSFESGRHAAVVAADSELTVLIEERSPFVKPVRSDRVDVSIFGDGPRSVVLFADETEDESASHGIHLLTISSESTTLGRALRVSQAAADERFPAGAAAAPGDYGLAWQRGAEFVFDRCQVAP